MPSPEGHGEEQANSEKAFSTGSFRKYQKAGRGRPGKINACMRNMAAMLLAGMKAGEKSQAVTMSLPSWLGNIMRRRIAAAALARSAKRLRTASPCY